MIEVKKCTGCSACYAVCPMHCIDMVEEQEGFLNPTIDKDMCINCDLCKKVCPIEKEISVKEEQRYYVAYNRDASRHEKSSSGGIFVEVSDWILEKGGIVVGAAFNEDFELKHIIASDKSERNKILGSKYLQSDTQDSYKVVLEALKEKRPVLYSGTACQIAGVKSFLQCKGQSDEHLFTVEIVCHGVASPKVFADFLKHDAKGRKIEELSFTNKQKPGEIKGFYRKFSDGTEEYTKFYKTSYGKLFLKNYTLREACYECQYSRYDRKVGDLVIGDLWGKNIQKSELKSELGVSIIIVNNGKGECLFNEVKEKLYYKECGVEDILQPNLLGASERPVNREKFWRDYQKYSYSSLEKKWNVIIFLEKVQKKIFGK